METQVVSSKAKHSSTCQRHHILRLIDVIQRPHRSKDIGHVVLELEGKGQFVRRCGVRGRVVSLGVEI